MIVDFMKYKAIKDEASLEAKDFMIRIVELAKENSVILSCKQKNKIIKELAQKIYYRKYVNLHINRP